MMPFHYGVGVALRDAGLLKKGTPLAGASGGAITAAALACDLPADKVLEGAAAVAEDCREKGAFRRMLLPARKLCSEVLPPDAHQLMSGDVRVAILQVLPRPKRLFIDEWDSKEDVVDSLIASSNIPFVLGPSLLVPFRQGLCVDGSFATEVGTFGCGDTSAARTVRVMAFDPKDFGSFASLISDNPRDSIAPGLRQGDGFPYTSARCLKYAAGSPPPTMAEIQDLFQLGYRAAEMWIEEEAKRPRTI